MILRDHVLFFSADGLFFKSPAYRYQGKETDAVAEVYPEENYSTRVTGDFPNISYGSLIHRRRR